MNTALNLRVWLGIDESVIQPFSFTQVRDVTYYILFGIFTNL